MAKSDWALAQGTSGLFGARSPFWGHFFDWTRQAPTPWGVGTVVPACSGTPGLSEIPPGGGVKFSPISKPAALGLLRALELVQRWPHASHTVTSVFDSGVGLCFAHAFASQCRGASKLGVNASKLL